MMSAVNEFHMVHVEISSHADYVHVILVYTYFTLFPWDTVGEKPVANSHTVYFLTFEPIEHFNHYKKSIVVAKKYCI